MSSVEFHEDEWGRHWSYAPALHGTQLRLHYSIGAALVDVAGALTRAISGGFGLLGERDDAAKLRDLHGENDVPPVRYARYEGVRDEFGRALP